MSQTKRSKEERFLLHMYEMAKKSGDPQNEVDRYAVGRLVGEHTRGVDNTVQMLSKNGLLKKGEGSAIHLSPSGLHYVEENLL